MDGGVAVDPVPPFMVKGKSKPVDAAAVTVLRPVAAHHPARPDDVFLGRESELARILDLLAQTRTGRGQLLEVRGGPGLGKSALVRAVVERCGDAVAVLNGPSRRFGRSASHQAVRRLLRDLTGVDPAEPAAAQVEALRAVVGRAAPQVLPWFPLLAATMGVALPDTPQLQDLDDRYRPTQTGRALADLLSAVLTGPALLVLEGADDMDDASVTALREVLAVLPGRPWLVLVTRRTDDGGLLPDADDEHPVLDLEPLRPATSLALLAAWSDRRLAVGGIPRHLLGDQQLRALAAKAGGNPMHLHSLLELALARGTVDGLPVGVEEVIGAEVDALEPRARTILRLASVLGEQLDTGHLAELVAPEGWTLRPEDLGRLSGQLVLEGPSATWYRFSSTLLHETVYAGLPYRLRRRLHLRAGESLEAAAGPPQLAALSTHFFEAGRYDKALDYSARAAERASRAYSSLEALHLYERALVCAARTPDVVPALVGQLHEAAGDAAEMAGLSAAAISHYRTARTGRRTDPCALGGLIAKEVGLHQRVGAFDRSTRIAGYALRILDGVPGEEADALRSRLAVQTAFVHHLRARHATAVSWSTRAVELAQRSGDAAVLARAYNAHALVLAVAGIPADRPYGELALASSEESGDLRLQVKCLTNLSISAIIDGRWPRAESLLVRAAEVAERLGDAANVVNVTYNRCDVLVRQGRWSEAAPLLAQVGREARAQDDQELVALVALEQGKVATGQGRVAARSAWSASGPRPRSGCSPATSSPLRPTGRGRWRRSGCSRPSGASPAPWMRRTGPASTCSTAPCCWPGACPPRRSRPSTPASRRRRARAAWTGRWPRSARRRPRPPGAGSARRTAPGPRWCSPASASGSRPSRWPGGR
ncbi:MAG: hypothetical protein DCC50_15220 [Acidobacteria bacterium]|nr:MAG: hypothetical protein DCC50_15220 [Acidobacteriota bacterium]